MQIGLLTVRRALVAGLVLATAACSGGTAAAGRVVVVGESSLPDDTTVPWIATATSPQAR